MSVLDDADLEKLLEAATEQAFRSSGAGSFFGQYTTILKQIDRFGYNLVLPNHEVTGLTFITRPKLNLHSSNLRQDHIMATLDTRDPYSLGFAIRCLLDTNFAQQDGIFELAHMSPFINAESPFLIPLTNCLASESGWPDPSIDTETTEGGFFSENITFAKGSDRLRRSYDLTLTFRDIQGGFIAMLLYYWHRYIELVTTGEMIAYPSDIAARRLNYTCSIYRFVLDPSRKFITKFARATGCFPKSFPWGAFFNRNERESFISSGAQFSIPFQVNFVSYMDPMIFRDFNTIAKRFCPDIEQRLIAPVEAENNFIGLPYIDIAGQQNRLDFRCLPEDLVSPLDVVWKDIEAKIQAAEAAYAASSDTKTLTAPGQTETITV